MAVTGIGGNPVNEGKIVRSHALAGVGAVRTCMRVVALPTGVGAVRTCKGVVTLSTGVGAVRTCKRAEAGRSLEIEPPPV